MSVKNFPELWQGEKQPLIFGFADELDSANGETISSVTSITVYAHSGTDGAPNAILSGSANILNGGTGDVQQWIDGGVAGVTYQFVCLVLTSAGRKIKLVARLKCADPTA